MAASDVPAIAHCPLAAHGTAGGCGWCGTPLPPRRRRWCSDRCAQSFTTNHWFMAARTAARRRDRHRCVRCGVGPRDRAAPVATAFPDRRAYLAARREDRRWRADHRLEVDHIEPCIGTHGDISCLHHQANLQTLCRPCHLEVTRQRRLIAQLPPWPEEAVPVRSAG